MAPARDDDAPVRTGRWDNLPLEELSARVERHSIALTGERLSIGRDGTSDVVVDDILASRHHAELRRRGEGWDVLDAGSQNGTFLNGRRVERAALSEADVIVVGRHSFRFVKGRLEEEVDTGEVAYAADGLVVRLDDGTLLVDDVSFSLAPRSMLAVVGPSGAGKSTLMAALTGQRPAAEGDVLYDGQSLYAGYDALRRRIGFVPQDDVVHQELTVRRALEYAADLRFPADAGSDERRRRVEEALQELDLASRAEVRVSSLSGGQRKRVSVALELLTEPSLLFLDEPTSGLDPHYERSLMEVFRRLADGGRTVVIATHSTQSLQLCDRLLVLAPGGKVAYFGAPQLVSSYFGCEDVTGVFGELMRGDVDWAARFREHPMHAQFVQRPLRRETPPSHDEATRRARTSPAVWLKQLVTLTRRYAAVTMADRRNVALLLLQAPALGLLMLVALPADELGEPPPGELRLISQAALVLLVLIIGVTWLGMSNAVREIAKELPLFRRERAAGVSVSAYLGSKVAVLGVLTVAQAFVLVALATARQGGPEDAVVLGWARGELLAMAALGGFAAMTLGLLVSALARTADRATTVLPIVLVFQLVLALGGVFPELGDKPVLEQARYAATAQWTFAGMASTADLNDLQQITGVLTQTPSVNVEDPSPLFDALERGDRGEPVWDHEASAWVLDAGALLALAALALLGAWLALRREER